MMHITDKKCGCCFNNPLQRDGTSQRQRLLDTLKPTSVSVDERDLSSLLLYARDYSRLLQFYSPANSKSGNWLDFIESDITTLVALIQHYDYEPLKTDFDELLDNYERGNLTAKKKQYTLLLQRFFSLALDFDGWYRGSVEGLSLYKTLKRLIDSNLSGSLKDILGQYLKAEVVGLAVNDLELSEFSPVWGLSDVTADVFLFPSTPLKTADLNTAVDQLKVAFNDLYDALVYLVKNAQDYLTETLDAYPQHRPHMALFISFLQLFQIAQDHLNSLTARHLDFYYQQVLGLRHQAAIPDQVHLVFELAKNAFQHKIEKGSSVRAGKDSLGNNLFYTTDNELVVNKTTIDQAQGLKTVFVDKDDTGQVKNIYAAMDADSEDGLGAAIENEQGKWETFGSRGMPYASIGFAISSPMFLLAEGKREINITFNLRAAISGNISTIEMELEHNVKVYATGEKAWFELPVENAVIAGNRLTYTLQLGVGAEAILAYDEKIHGKGYSGESPLLKFELVNTGLPAALTGLSVFSYSDDTLSYSINDLVFYQGLVYQALTTITDKGFRPVDFLNTHWELIEYAYPYKYFQAMELNSLDIEVKVGEAELFNGIKTVILENDSGLLDPAKPFQPFGQNPKQGSRFLIGSAEIFSKSLTEISIKMEWSGLPPLSGEYVDFSSYYDGYDETFNNNSFTVDLTFLEDASWNATESCSDKYLFDDEAISCDGSPLVSRNTALKDFKRLDTLLSQGYMAITLDRGFYHDIYPKVLTEAAIDMATGSSPPDTLPNAPYTPEVNQFSLSYTAFESIDYNNMDKNDFRERVEKFYHLGPFGTQEIFPVADDSSVKKFIINRKLVAEFNVSVKDKETDEIQSMTAEGNLYIGLKDLKPEQNLSILFQPAEGSENPDLPAQNIVWSYLTGQGWKDFDITEILADGSNGLLGSGIIQFAMADAMSNEHTILPSGLYWIKASVFQSSAAVPQLIALHTQAVRASFQDNDNSEDHLAIPLPASTISKLKSRVSNIKSVSQPYASSNGQMEESADSFYTRVSERLRHKKRAITIFDYERMVLQEFPEIYKVKCINHSNRCTEHAPGQVRLIVVPNLRNKNAIDKLKPQVSLNKLTSIESYLKKYSSDFTRIAVTNPDYEKVRVNFNVFFNTGFDKGLYTTQLNDDIIKFLSPWLYDEGADLTFGGRIHRSSILEFVEQRRYVNFVTEFQLDHFYTMGKDTEVEKYNVEEANATRASSALVSFPQHAITALDIPSEPAVSGADEDCIPDSACENCRQPAGTAISEFRRYFGNKRSLELHDLNNTQPQCFIQKIKTGRGKSFSRIEEALEQGYDYCAYCFSRELSER
ncbi:MAG: hypothetical protein GY744_02765 [Gammaproteobacteria bacterium]|nr:hypothetical protein [Gammaproteobacteria bacterium]